MSRFGNDDTAHLSCRTTQAQHAKPLHNPPRDDPSNPAPPLQPALHLPPRLPIHLIVPLTTNAIDPLPPDLEDRDAGIATPSPSIHAFRYAQLDDQPPATLGLVSVG